MHYSVWWASVFMFLKQNVKWHSVWVLAEASKTENKTIFAEHPHSKWGAGAPMLDMPRMWSCRYVDEAQLLGSEVPCSLPPSWRRMARCFLLTSSLWEAELDSGELGPNGHMSSSGFRALRVSCVGGRLHFHQWQGGGISSEGHAEEGNVN